MKAIGFFAVLAVAAGAIVCFSRARRYGGIKASFHKNLRDDRRGLAAAHKNVKGLQAAVDRELQQARQELAAAEAAYKRQVEAAASALQRLEAPGNGDRIWLLGGATLYQHKVVIGNQTIDLYGIWSTSGPGARSVGSG